MTPSETEARGAPEAAAIALWWTLIVLAAARAALSFVPAMSLWSLNLHRFLSPSLAWSPWAVGALALAPPVARRLVPAFESLGGLATRRPALALPLCAAAAAAWVLAFPDRVWFVGDFLLRQYTLEGKPTAVAAWYPYALPLDLFLHDTVGRVLIQRLGMVANGAGRVLGAAEAALLALAAMAFARAVRASGAAAVAVAAIVFWGGYLTLYTGYNKAFSEMPLVLATVGALGVHRVRGEGSPLLLGIVLAAAFVLHRSALGLVPAGLFAFASWLRGNPGAWRRPVVVAAAVVPAIALAVMLPRIIAIVTRIDPTHFTPVEVKQSGVLAAAFTGGRLLDLLNLALMLSPLALAVPAMATASLAGGIARRPKGRELAFLAFLALPFVAVAPFVHPGQGYMRDWDDFAAAGMALSLLAAWLVARTLEGAPRYCWLAVTATLAAVVPSAQWSLHHTDIARGLARVEAFLHEPPSRTASERTRTWDFLGWRKTDLGDYAGAAEAFAHVAEWQPSPRVLRQWAMTEALRGDPRRGQEIYRQLLTRAPDNASAWFELARLSYEIGDFAESRRAAGELVRLRPNDEAARALVAHLDSLQAAQ
jgi:tetratricopeptide (TPR) repeat protein